MVTNDDQVVVGMNMAGCSAFSFFLYRNIISGVSIKRRHKAEFSIKYAWLCSLWQTKLNANIIS